MVSNTIVFYCSANGGDVNVQLFSNNFLVSNNSLWKILFCIIRYCLFLERGLSFIDSAAYRATLDTLDVMIYACLPFRATSRAFPPYNNIASLCQHTDIYVLIFCKVIVLHSFCIIYKHFRSFGNVFATTARLHFSPQQRRAISNKLFSAATHTVITNVSMPRASNRIFCQRNNFDTVVFFANQILVCTFTVFTSAVFTL